MTTRSLSEAELRKGWSDWLSSVFLGRSTDLVTLTFAPRLWERDWLGDTGPTRTRVTRAAQRFARSLTRSLARPSFFIVRELGSMNGRAHLHSLVCDPEGSSTRGAIVRHCALEGFVNLTRTSCTPAEYVSKYVSKSDRDFWLAGGPLWGGGTLEVDSVGALGAGEVRVGVPRDGRLGL